MADSFLNKSGLTRLWGKIKAALGSKADKSTTLLGYGITNAYTKTEVDTKVNAKANSASTLSGYGITDAYTKTEVNTELNKKENSSNKVTSWQSTPDNTHYPSEKLVKDGLNGKANSSHTHTKSQITDFPSSMPASDVYSWAKASSKPSYGISEISGLQSALDGKEVTSNKVTSWSSTTTDVHYPSEKLVKSGLDGKANAIHTHDDRYYTESEVNSLLLGYTKNPELKTFSMEYKGTNYRDLTKDFTLPSMNINDNFVYSLTGNTYVYSASSYDGPEVHVTLKLPTGGTYSVTNRVSCSNMQSNMLTVSKIPYSGTLPGGANVYKADLTKVQNAEDDEDGGYRNYGFAFSGTIVVRRIS